MKIKKQFFKRALSGVLSAACVLSGTAFAGATATADLEVKGVKKNGSKKTK